MAFDTTPEAAEFRRTALAALSGSERLRQALELSEFIAEFSSAGTQMRASASRQKEPGPPNEYTRPARPGMR